MTDPLRRELLPCPFCGGYAKHSWSFGAVYVTCQSCGAARSSSQGDDGDEVVVNAIAKWNTRAPSPEIARARAEEREEAAKIAEELNFAEGVRIAAAIRARGGDNPQTKGE